MSEPPGPTAAAGMARVAPGTQSWGRNLALRIGSAALIIPILFAAILWRNEALLDGCVVLAATLGLSELYTLTLPDRRERRLLLALATLATFGLVRLGASGAALVIASFAVTALAVLLFRPAELATVVTRATAAIAGFVYVGLGLSFLAALKKLDGRSALEGGHWVLVLLTLSWFGDTFAYFTGRAFGRHKLYPAISPGKTVEGAIGGLAGSLFATVLAKLWYLPALTWGGCVLLALPAGAVGQIGDLVESMLKRALGVKDSGRLLPGHGGMLDRIDAVLFAAPVVFLYARWIFPWP